jgi:hypothetical protein
VTRLERRARRIAASTAAYTRGEARVVYVDGDPVIVTDGNDTLGVATRLERSQLDALTVATRDDVEERSEHTSPDCEGAAFRGAGALPRGWKYVLDTRGNLDGIACPACAATFELVRRTS